jgi:hypothetical protein
MYGGSSRPDAWVGTRSIRDLVWGEARDSQ